MTTDGGIGGSSTTSGAGATGGASSAGGADSFDFDAGGTSADAGPCVFPMPDGAGGDTNLPVQSWCAPVAINPPECPVDKPLAGSACSTAGLRCAYEKSLQGFLLETCSQSWGEVAHSCNHA